MITTKDEFARAFQRLRQRDPEALAAFIMSLAHDPGPIGAQVRTFIAGDDVAETAEYLNFLQTRVASKCTDVSRIGNVEVPHGFRVPAAGGFDGEWLTPHGQ